MKVHAIFKHYSLIGLVTLASLASARQSFANSADDVEDAPKKARPKAAGAEEVDSPKRAKPKAASSDDVDSPKKAKPKAGGAEDVDDAPRRATKARSNSEDVDDAPKKPSKPTGASSEDVGDLPTKGGKPKSTLTWYTPSAKEAFAMPPPPPPPVVEDRLAITLDAGWTSRAFVSGSVHGFNTEIDAKFGIGLFGLEVGLVVPGTRPLIGVSVGRNVGIPVSDRNSLSEWRILVPYGGISYVSGALGFARIGVPGIVGARYTRCKGDGSLFPFPLHVDLRVLGVEAWVPMSSTNVSTIPISVTIFTLDAGGFF